MVQSGSWKDIILDEGTKRSIMRDVIGFFDARETYAEFGTPWKVRRSRSWASCLCSCAVARTDFPWIARQWQNNDRESAHEGTYGTTHTGPDACCQDTCTTLFWSADVGSADLYESEAGGALPTSF